MTFTGLSTLSGYAYQLRRDKYNSLAFLSACSVADHSNLACRAEPEVKPGHLEPFPIKGNYLDTYHTL